jgi:hypothetical protein
MYKREAVTGSGSSARSRFYLGWRTRVAVNLVPDRVRDKKLGVSLLLGRAWARPVPQMSALLNTSESSVRKVYPRRYSLGTPRVRLYRVYLHTPALCLNTPSRYTLGRVVHPICAPWPSTRWHHLPAGSAYRLRCAGVPARKVSPLKRVAVVSRSASWPTYPPPTREPPYWLAPRPTDSVSSGGKTARVVSPSTPNRAASRRVDH